MIAKAVSLMLMRIAVLTLVLSSTGAIFMARHELDHREHFARELRRVSVVPPSTQPPMTQESIDLALEMFAIEIPDNTQRPRLDMGLEDRGLTTLNGWGSKLEVTIGPAAFTSWALLGSTLAHELEVHCRQNFFVIRMKDALGLQGTEQAEREAYMHELANSDRFNLKTSDQLNIKATMDFYYPLSKPKDDAFSARK
ncbi:MAG: hypothetical protein ACOVS5_16965 [Oligoflexus sp.]|jgi:hypothetical protein